jgi:nitrous oxidase accessory protein
LLLLALALAAPVRVITVFPGGPVPSLKAALALAQDGDTILVRAGIYRESQVVVSRQVVIIGMAGAILDGGGDALLLVNADSVTIRGLELRNVAASNSEDRAAIRLNGVHGCLVAGNVIRAAFFGIYAARAEHCVIRENIIIGLGAAETRNANAIHLYATRDFVVSGNQVTQHRDGIYLEFGRHASIEGNTSSENTRYGLHFMFSDSCAYQDNVFRDNRAGVAVMYSSQVEMRGNTFSGATGPAAYGLLLKEIRDSHLAGSHFSDNTVALSVEGSDRLVASGNDFVRNGWALRLLASTDNGRFEGNRFAGNAFDVVTNSRQSSTDFRGNFWDRYQGYDLDHDGFGDVPFRPVRLFGLIVAQHPPAAMLLHSLLVSLLETAERVAPVLTPELPVDPAPLMRWGT